MRLKTSLFFGVVAVLLYGNYCSGKYIVTTKTGSINGFVDTVDDLDVYTYLGIPYAVPPIGELRFKAPKPVEPWSGVYNATKFSAACMQYIQPPFFEWHPTDVADFHEDCLYLNIWVPVNNIEHGRKAVMVWLYGGAFNTGSANSDIYNGKFLAVHEDVIVVTLNYRLGAFGFLYAGTKDAPGNMGLKDQVLALKWIKDNINAFGGDPSQITVFGESAGSLSISAHLVSPLARGLFKRAILQSGTVYNPSFLPNKKEALDKSNNFAAYLGCVRDHQDILTSPSQVVSCLRNLNSSIIAITERAIINPLLTSFLPTYGDDYLPNHPISEFKAGNILNVTILVGEVRDEGSFFLGNIDHRLLEINNPVISKDMAANYIRNIFNYSTNPPPNVIFDYYLKNVNDFDNSAILKKTYDTIGDWLFHCPGIFLSDTSAVHGRDVYHYILTHRRKVAPYREWFGVPHFEDVPFVFGRHLSLNKSHDLKDVEFSRMIMRIWSTFAKTGKPSYEALGQEWPVYSKEIPVAFVLNPDCPVIIDPYKDCQFWKQYF